MKENLLRIELEEAYNCRWRSYRTFTLSGSNGVFAGGKVYNVIKLTFTLLFGLLIRLDPYFRHSFGLHISLNAMKIHFVSLKNLSLKYY